MTKAYNILFISVTTITGGGTEYIFSLAKELNRNHKFNVTIVAPKDGNYYVNQFKLNDIHYISSNIRKISIFTFFDLIKICRTQKIDLIHSNGKGAGIYSRCLKLLLSIPVVHSHHGFHLQNLSYFYRKLYVFSEKILSKFTSKYIFVSNSEQYSFSESINVPNYKKVVIFNSIHPERLKLGNLNRGKFKLNSRDKIIICASRISPEKGLETIIKSIPYLISLYGKDNLKILVVGDKINPDQKHKAYKNKLIKLIKQLKVEKFIEIWPENKNIIDLLNISDIYVSASKGEGFSLALLEAMLLGKPIIASNVAGNKDAIINGFTGILFQQANYFELAKSIFKLLNNHVYANKIGIEAKKYAAEKFSFATMFKSTKKTYIQILNSKL